MMKKGFFKLFFQSVVLLDQDWIWGWPGYVKVSVWAALKVCNNGLVIIYDMGRKSGKILERQYFCFKSQK